VVLDSEAEKSLSVTAANSVTVDEWWHIGCGLAAQVMEGQNMNSVGLEKQNGKGNPKIYKKGDGEGVLAWVVS
jgi:hypothetical protein